MSFAGLACPNSEGGAYRAARLEEVALSLPEVVSREQWTEARLRLLAEEKEMTRRHDALNAERRRLPMVKVEKDYYVTLDRDRPQLQFNYRPEPQIVADQPSMELSGFSSFLRDGDEIFHTYSAYARGTEYMGSAYTLLDLTAFGRSEDWEEPKGRAPKLHGADPTFTD